MSELISGKEALIALANGEDVQYISSGMAATKYWSDSENTKNFTIHDFYSGSWAFRIKPRTVKLNGVEVPAPFLPEEGEIFYHISPEYEKGYSKSTAHERNETTWQQFGAYRTEDEIKQVVAALRSVFK